MVNVFLQVPLVPPKPKHLSNIVSSMNVDFESAAIHLATSQCSSASGSVEGSAKATATPSDASIALPTPTLEDLAISFITDAIRSVSPDHLLDTKSAAPSQVPPKTVSALETKQKRLERHILESKALMTQLGEARTKTDRDRILALLREKNRCEFFVVYLH